MSVVIQLLRYQLYLSIYCREEGLVFDSNGTSKYGWLICTQIWIFIFKTTKFRLQVFLGFIDIPGTYFKSNKLLKWLELVCKELNHFGVIAGIFRNPRHKHTKWPPSDLTPWTLTLGLAKLLCLKSSLTLCLLSEKQKTIVRKSKCRWVKSLLLITYTLVSIFSRTY